jgi:hypothetical protein
MDFGEASIIRIVQGKYSVFRVVEEECLLFFDCPENGV